MNTSNEIKETNGDVKNLFSVHGPLVCSIALMLLGVIGVFIFFYVISAYAFITVPVLFVVNALVSVFGGPALGVKHLIEVGYALAFVVAIGRWVVK